MKKYKKIIYLTIIFIVLINITKINHHPHQQVVVQNKEYLTSASEAGFESEELYRCVLDTLGNDRTSATPEELSQITEVICREQNITSTKGIEKLTSLRYLNLYNNHVSEIDLSKNTNLVMLNLTFNNISSIDLSKNTNLQQLYLNGNSISSINLTNNPKLIDLNIYNNNLTSIDVSNLTDLKFLLLSLNKLTKINLSNNTKLEHVYLSGNNINSLTLPNNANNLTRLDLNANNLTNIDLSKLTNLNYLIVSANNLSNLDVSKNTNLEYLYSSSNKISAIDLSNNTKLIDLDLYNNKLSSIDVSKLLNLQYINVSVNNLSTLNLNGLTKLTKLYASSNNLSNLSLSSQNYINEINAVFNNFNNYNINDKSQIKYMFIENDWLEHINLSEFTSLTDLGIEHYQIIPVYGSSITTSDIIKKIPTNLTLNKYNLYSGFEIVTGLSNSICKYDVEYTVDGSTSTTEKTTINTCIENSYKSNTITGENGTYVRLQLKSDDMKINNITTSANLKYDGYYEIRFMSLPSDIYTINEKENTIDVETDDDATILKNLKISWDDAKININDNKLQIYYNEELLKEYTLERITNPKTGSFYIYIILIISILSIGIVVCGFAITKKYKNN